MTKTTRRKFIWLANSGIAAMILFAWNKLTLNHLKISDKKNETLPLVRNQEVTFYENYIVIGENGKFTVLSSHCTHLGCKISKLKNKRLICPCHGSQYNLEGKAVKGPAHKNLDVIPFSLSADNSSIEISG